jgi:hypothetical protein
MVMLIFLTTQVAIIPDIPPIKKFLAWLAIETFGCCGAVDCIGCDIFLV